MTSARPFRRLLCALFFALAATSSHALQLGETVAQITARHGAAAVEDHGRQLAVYYWEGWSAQLEFKDGAVGKLTYRRKNGYLADPEIQSLLQANGGVERWRETTNLGTKTRQWVREDGAVAAGDAVRPTGMVFQSAGTAPETFTPAEAIVADSFLKIDVPANPLAPEKTSAAPQAEPPISLHAPRLRSEPQLRSDKIPAENAAPAPETSAVAAAPPAIAKSRGPAGGKSPVILGLIFGVVLIGGASFYFLARRKPARLASPAAPAAPATAAPATGANDAADLDSLSDDQVELLIGEIFRRQGYVIELSAAPGTDSSSDLILRRDGESIPVQSKDWKTSRVTEQEVREFYGVMAATAAPRGVFVTSGTFAREARDFAATNAIELIDRTGLMERIAAVRRPDENFFDVASWIEDFTAYARIFDPECPCCSQPMSIRQNRVDGSAYWVCASYPRCAGKRETRRNLVTVLAAA